MTVPCEQEANISKIGVKVDRIHDIVTDLALQNARITSCEDVGNDHEARIRKIEKTPTRMLYWIGGIVATVVAGFLTHRLWG